MRQKVIIAAGFPSPIQDWVTVRLCHVQDQIKLIPDVRGAPDWAECRRQFAKFTAGGTNIELLIAQPPRTNIPQDLANHPRSPLDPHNGPALLQLAANFLSTREQRLPTPLQIKERKPAFITLKGEPSFRVAFENAGYTASIADIGTEAQVELKDLWPWLQKHRPDTVIIASRYVPWDREQQLRHRYTQSLFPGKQPREALARFFASIIDESNRSQMQDLAGREPRGGLHVVNGWKLAWAQEQLWHVGGDFLLVCPNGDNFVVFLGDLMGKGASAHTAAAELKGAAGQYWRHPGATHQEFLQQITERLKEQNCALDHFLAIVDHSGGIEYSLSGSVRLWLPSGELAQTTGMQLGYDPQHVLARMEAGKFAVTTDGLENAPSGWIANHISTLDAEQFCSGLIEQTQNEKLRVDSDPQDDRTVLLFERSTAPEPSGATEDLAGFARSPTAIAPLP